MQAVAAEFSGYAGNHLRSSSYGVSQSGKCRAMRSDGGIPLLFREKSLQQDLQRTRSVYLRAVYSRKLSGLASSICFTVVSCIPDKPAWRFWPKRNEKGQISIFNLLAPCLNF